MKFSIHRRGVAAVSAAAVSICLLAGTIAPSSAATSVPPRIAKTDVVTSYLSETLGLPSDTVVEVVTYDRFQWLLQQPGQFAFLVGSTTDAGFKSAAVKVDAAAKVAKVKKVYWFDPNLTGLSGARNLDIRNPEGINLAATSRTIFGNVWKNVIGQYLGNGVKSVPAANRTTVTITADDSVVNDSVKPLFEYRNGRATPSAADETVFFVYDKDHKANGVADKIVDWVKVDAGADTGLASAFSAIGGGEAIDQLSQFHWWKDSNNTKHKLTNPDPVRYGGDILTDADASNGWRVQQVTYPELVHLLNIKESTDKNFVILFGGTWCPNTRAVIKFVNKEAQANGVATVYNFDLVLDGGTTNGTNGGANPVHVRAAAASGTTFNFRPSYVYGDLVRTYLKNLVTEYDPNTGVGVTYYPNGDLTAFPDVVRRLQVPFLINYQHGTGANPATNSVKRQWIQQNIDASTGLPSYKEYMSQWWFTNPNARLGLDFDIPADESKLTNDQKGALATARANVAFGLEAVSKLGDFFGGLPGAVASKQTLLAPTVTAKVAPKITLNFTNTFGRVPAGVATVLVAGKQYKGQVSGNAVVFNLPKLKAGQYNYTVNYAGDAQILGFKETGKLVIKK